MACYYPLPAIRVNGSVQILARDALGTFTVPCGRCVGCRLERSRQWATRIMHESQMHESNAFITLTYDDEHLPRYNSLHYPDFQKFMKRLRKSLGDKLIRYYVAGEYGDDFGRPHYHAIIFGHDFDDRVVLNKTASGYKIYRSPSLESLWPFGYSSVADVSFDSAAYVARYVMKKVFGDDALSHYAAVDTDTGEVVQRVPEFNRMSNGNCNNLGGIGKAWFDKYGASDVTPHDRVRINGHDCKPPRYYDKLIKRVDPARFEQIKSQRIVDMQDNLVDNTPKRLAVREKVAVARLFHSVKKI